MKKLFSIFICLGFIAYLIFPTSVLATKTAGQKSVEGDTCKTFSTVKADLCVAGTICNTETVATSNCGGTDTALGTDPCTGICRSVTSGEVGFGLGTKSNFTDTGLGQSSDLKSTIANIINIILGFLGILAVLVILYGGFKWMTAAGNEDGVSEARGLIVNGVIGLVVIFVAWGIASFVISQLQSVTQ